MKHIFSYSKFSAFGSIDDYDGFKIEIFDNGVLYYKTINIDDECKTIKKYKISISSIKKIQDLINSNKKIFRFYDDLDICTLDGCGHEFIFFNNKKEKKITAWNIEESKNFKFIHIIIFLLISLFNKEFKETYKNIKQQQFLLKLFYKISDILKQEGYILNIYEFKSIKT